MTKEEIYDILDSIECDDNALLISCLLGHILMAIRGMDDREYRMAALIETIGTFMQRVLAGEPK